MNTPPYLMKDDKIGIAAPARFAEQKDVDAAVKRIVEWGFEAIPAGNISSRWNQFSGNDDERRGEFQKLLDNHVYLMHLILLNL